MKNNIINNFDYILGAITAIIIPSLSYLFRVVNRKYKRCKFKELLFEEYVNTIETEIKNKNKEHEFVDYEKVLAKQIRRLDYLKNEEISFINSDNQFYYARSIEYTKSLLKLLSNETVKYEYRSMNPTEEQLQEQKEFTKNKKHQMMELVKIYKRDFDKYMNLEIDSLEDS